MSRGWRSWLPPLLALAVSLLVLPVGYMLTHPFWLDEAWVAVGTRAPLSYIRTIAFSGPAGFALLLRIPVPGDHGLRLFTLAFSAAAVYAAFLLGRDLGWSRKRDAAIVGSMAGLAVVMSPWSLLRIDLKHYTAEAFLCLILLWLTARLEANWSRRNLVVLSALAACFSVFGWATMFVSVGIFIGLAVISAAHREWDRLRDTIIAGGSVATFFFTVWWVLIKPFSDTVEGFWEFAYLVGGPIDIARQTWWRFSDLMRYYPSNSRFIAVALFLTGIGVLVRKRPATSIAVVLSGLVAAALGRLSLFPFLDRRTSHYLLMIFIAVVGIGLGMIVVGVLRKMTVAGVVVAVVLTAGLVWAGAPWFRYPALPDYDVRSQVQHVAAERVDGDVIIVSRYARHAFAYYWPNGRVVFTREVNFIPRVVEDGVIIVEWFNIPAAVSEGIEAARQPGASGRVWVIRSHLSDTGGSEADWAEAYAAAGITPESIEVGPEPVQVLTVDR